MKTPPQTSLNIPPEFEEIWAAWIYFKKVQHKFSYKDVCFEQIGLNKLIRLSDNNPQIAQEMIEAAIAGGWQGFHQLNNNGKQNSTDPLNFGRAYFNRERR